VRALAFILLLLAALAPAPAAFAHASLLSSDPADNVTIPVPPATLRLDFNEPVSPLVMSLINPAGQTITLTKVIAADKSVTITPPTMKDEGTYVLSWRVVSADGHPVGGVVSFAIGKASAGRTAVSIPSDRAVQAAIWLAKVVLYIGLFVGVGGAAFAAWIVVARPMPGERYFFCAMLCGLVAAALSLPLQGLDALLRPLYDIWRPAVWAAGFGTSYGTTAIVAAGALFAGLISLRVAGRGLARSFSLAGIVGIGLALAASGHAATAAPRLVTAPVVFLHGVCVAFWVGSLLPLILTVRSGDRIALGRFSRAIPVPLVVLVVTGIALIYVQFDRPDALWTTQYGLVLSGKLLVVLALLVLAAANRYVWVPRLSAADSAPLVTSIAVEFALALVILGIVGLWRFTPPPRALAAAETTYIHFHGERAMAQIDLTPVRDRGAHVSIQVTDDAFRPVAAKEVTLVVWNPAAGIEPKSQSAVDDGGGNWHIDNVRVPVGGVWRMRIEILISDFEKVMIEDNVELPRTP
jgi:copper transport protein